MASDIALVVNAGDHGLISDISFGSDEMEREFNGQALLGKPWVETVTLESRPKIEALLHDALSRADPRWRHVNHPMPRCV